MALNRKLKMGMVGGGPGAFIGDVHRKASRMDGGIDLVAGAFDINPRKSKQQGREKRLRLTELMEPIVRAQLKGALMEHLKLKVMQLKDLMTFKSKSKGEDWTKSLGWFIPRKYRHVIGDILEDCAEMREAGCREKRIKLHVVYQWLIAVITLVPTAVTTSITHILKQVMSRPK